MLLRIYRLRGMNLWLPGDYNAKNVVPRLSTFVCGHCQCPTLIRLHRVRFPGIGRRPKRTDDTSPYATHGKRFFFFFEKVLFSNSVCFWYLFTCASEERSGPRSCARGNYFSSLPLRTSVTSFVSAVVSFSFSFFVARVSVVGRKGFSFLFNVYLH